MHSRSSACSTGLFTLACIRPAPLNSDQLPSCGVDAAIIRPVQMPWNPEETFPRILEPSGWDCLGWRSSTPWDLYSAFPANPGCVGRAGRRHPALSRLLRSNWSPGPIRPLRGPLRSLRDAACAAPQGEGSRRFRDQGSTAACSTFASRARKRSRSFGVRPKSSLMRRSIITPFMMPAATRTRSGAFLPPSQSAKGP